MVFFATMIMICCFSCISAVSLAETIQTNSDESTETTQYSIKNESKHITFTYPSYCSLEDEDSMGVIVRLDTLNYVSISIPRRNISGTRKLSDNIGDDTKILMLQDDIHIFAIHGDDNHHMPNVDIVEIGLNLPENTGLIVNVTAEYGHTEIYDVLMTIIKSLKDTDSFKKWLTEEWIPSVLC